MTVDPPAPEVMEQQPQESPLSESNNSAAASEDEDVRYEPITEAFIYEEEVIHPCYVVLPFVADNDVETLCRRSIKVCKTLPNYVIMIT